MSLLWIQKMKNVLVKTIKGVDNPADLGTKALSRDKIRKYLKALEYKGDCLDDEEQQVRRTKNGMKTVSVSMIAKIVAILMSEGICVEGAFTVVKEQNPWHELNMSCCLICIVVCCIVSIFMPAAIWDQAFRFGKEEKEREKKFGEKKRKREMADERNMPQEMMSLRPPNEPTPTEEGEETMEKRVKELKQQALESKAARQMALEKALQEKALEEEKAAEEKENPTGSGALQPEAAVGSGSTLEKKKESEVEKDKEDEHDEEDSESSEEEQSSSDEEEQENPTGSGKQQSVVNSDVPAVEEAVTTRKDVPAVEEAELQTQEEESKEEKRERLSREMDEHFKGVLRTLAGKVESSKNYSATRTVLSLWNSLTVSFMTPSDLQEDDLRDALLLAEINRETLDTLDRQKDRAEKFRVLLRAKAQYLEAERSRKNEEIARKLGWIQQKMTEVRAEENALEKMTQFHESIEKYVTTGLRELKNLQKSNDAQEMEWSGLDYDMSKEGGDKLSSMTFYEKLFSERLNPSETSPITELETSLKEFESVTTIDLEAEGKTSAPSDAARPAMKKEPVGQPKTKPMPRPLHKGDRREEKKKEEKMLREKKKREEEEEAASAATANYDEAAKRPKKDGQELMKDLINSDTVPREHLEVEITQDVWSLLGWNSRERILGEQKTAERCYFCNAPGHRAFACGSMLRLACAWGQVTGQSKYGGYDRKHSLWCSSCAFANSMIAATRGEDIKKISGWYIHTRSACHSKDKCPLKPDEELLKMSAAELLRHLKEKGMFGKEEQELQEKEKEKIAMSRKSEPRSITASEEPERKRQKKERKEQEKRIKEEKAAEKKAEEDRLRKKREEEEERIRKETEDLKTRLRDSSNEILHGYLFDKDFRVHTQKALEAQAKYEKKLEYSILEQTPNYQSRLQEASEHNKRQIEEHNARMLREEKERILKEEEDRAKERMKRRAERKAAKKILKDVEKDGKREKKEKKQRKAKE